MPEEIVLKVDGIFAEDELFEELITTFGFPDMYGRSWHGMGEHAFYDPEMRIPRELTVEGFDNLENNIPESAAKLKIWLSELENCSVNFQ